MDFVGWFQAQPASLQPAILAALTQLSVFVLGFSTIAGTAWANRRNATKADADKQRLDIYLDAVRVIEEASSAQRKATTFVQSAAAAINLRQGMLENGSQPIPPTQRYREFMALHSAASHGTSQLMMFLERWAIVEPKLKLFRHGFFIRTMRLLRLMSELSGLYSDILPFEAADGTIVFRNTILPEDALARLDSATEQYAYEMGLLDAYFADLNVELQGLLLGHLFGRAKLERRDAPDPSQFTLRLDRYDEIMAKFQNEPEFKEYAEQEAKLRALHKNPRRR